MTAANQPARPALDAVHESVAVRIIQPLYELYRAARPAYRPAMAAAREGMSFRKASAAWPQEQRLRWILERLRTTTRYASEHSSFYRQRFADAGFDPRADFSFDDFARLPVLERADIREAGAAIRAACIPVERLRRDSTGGSSGQPTEVWRGPLELGWNESGTEYFMRRIGLPRGTSMGLLWGHHLDPVGSDKLRDRIRFFAENIRWFDCLRLSPEVFERFHAQFLKWRPNCIVAYAGALGAFAEYLDSQDVRSPGYPRMAFVTGAEKLLPHHRAAVERVFGRPVHERYGSRDVALLGFQVDPGRTLAYEVDWQNVHVEPETATPEAPILVTKLHADGMPMIRYRIGDLARFPASVRPGHPAFELPEVSGREVDRVWLPDGRWVNGLGFPHLMKDYGVETFQIVQAADYSVSVRIVPQAHFAPDAAAEIRALVEANLEGVPVNVVIVDSIERTRAGKWRPVVSHVDRTAPGGSP
jgi:phenylacetate-CoA ligase